MLSQVDFRYHFANTIDEMAKFPNPFDNNVCKCKETGFVYSFKEVSNLHVDNINVIARLSSTGTVLAGQWVRINAEADISYTGFFDIADWGAPASSSYILKLTFPTNVLNHVCVIFQNVGTQANPIYEKIEIDAITAEESVNTLTNLPEYNIYLRINAEPDTRFAGKYVIIPTIRVS